MLCSRYCAMPKGWLNGCTIVALVLVITIPATELVC